MDFGGSVVANMTVSNSERALLITDSRNLSFQNVEFKDGMVRFENSENVTLEGISLMIILKGLCWSSCENIRIVVPFNSIENVYNYGHQTLM